MVEQLHYTSCRRGVSGASGFQVRTVSPGLPQHLFSEIVAHSGYQRPREEDPARLPVAFRGYGLSNGQLAVTASRYAGKDYSGRHGNFFAHTLVFQPADAPAPSIIAAFWDGWVGGLRPEDDTDQIPAQLPELPPDEFQRCKQIALDRIQAFLTEPERRRRLRDGVTATLCYERAQRSVIYRDEPGNTLDWVAATLMCLPPSIVQHLSWSSYQFDSRNLCRINATIKETSFLLDETERDYQFLVLDALEDRDSNLERLDQEAVQSAAAYASAAVDWLVRAPDRLDAFNAFLNRNFVGLPVGPELGLLMKLWQHDASAGQWSNAELSALQELVRSKLAQDADDELLKTLSALACALLERRERTGAAVALDMLVDFADAGRFETARDEAAMVWLAGVKEALQERDADLLSEHRKRLRELSARADVWANTLKRHLLQEEQVDAISNAVSVADRDIVVEVFQMYAGILTDDPARNSVLAAAGKRLLAAERHGHMANEVLAVLASDPSELAEVTAAAAREMGNDDVALNGLATSTASVLAKLDHSTAERARMQWLQDQAWPLFHAEWSVRCRAANRPSVLLRSGMDTVRSVHRDLSQAGPYLVEMVRDAATNAGLAELRNMCLGLWNLDIWTVLPTDIRQELLDAADREIKPGTGDPNQIELAKTLESEYSKIDLADRVTNSKFILLLSDIQNSPDSVQASDIQRIVHSRPPADKRRFLDVALRGYVFARTNMIAQRIEACARVVPESEFVDHYKIAVRRLVNEGRDGELIEAVGMVVAPQGSPTWHQIVHRRTSKILDETAQSLAAIKDPERRGRILDEIERTADGTDVWARLDEVRDKARHYAKPLLVRAREAAQRYNPIGRWLPGPSRHHGKNVGDDLDDEHLGGTGRKRGDDERW